MIFSQKNSYKSLPFARNRGRTMLFAGRSWVSSEVLSGYESPTMTVIRTVALTGAAAMVAAILAGLVSGDFTGEGSVILDLVWGRVTLIDLYIGLGLFAVWIGFREKRPLRRAAWWLALIILGNLASALYVVIASFQVATPRELLLGRQVAAE